MKHTHPRLPRGFGSLKYLGKNRKNPYAVYAPVYHVSDGGYLCYGKPLCYVPDWYTGFAVLVSFRAGTYHPGDEIKISKMDRQLPEDQYDDFCRKVLRDLSIASAQSVAPTLKELEEEWYDLKFGEYAQKKLSIKSEEKYRRCVKAMAHLENKKIDQITTFDLQSILNEKAKVQKASSVSAILTSMTGFFNFAVSKDYIRKSPCALLYVPAIAGETEQAEPFTLNELRIIFRKAKEGDRTAIGIFVHCLSGFRISAYYEPGFKINTNEWYFQGGIKWQGGRDRIVPIHSSIIPFVLGMKKLYPVCSNLVNQKIEKFCAENGIKRRTSHDCRHTFKMLMDKFGVSDLAQRYMLGHTLGDIHNKVYSHLDLDDLRKEIEKIDIDVICNHQV